KVIFRTIRNLIGRDRIERDNWVFHRVSGVNEISLECLVPVYICIELNPWLYRYNFADKIIDSKGKSGWYGVTLMLYSTRIRPSRCGNVDTNLRFFSQRDSHVRTIGRFVNGHVNIGRRV